MRAFRNESAKRNPGNLRPGFGGRQALGRHGILVLSLVFNLDSSDEIAQNIGHIGQIEENIGQVRKYRAI